MRVWIMAGVSAAPKPWYDELAALVAQSAEIARLGALAEENARLQAGSRSLRRG